MSSLSAAASSAFPSPTRWHGQGATVTVLDAGEPGQASSAAAGMLAPLAESGKPGPFVQMALDSLRRWPSFVAQLREDAAETPLCILGPGTLRLARTEQEEDAMCESLAWQQTLGLPLHRLNRAEMPRIGAERRAGCARRYPIAGGAARRAACAAGGFNGRLPSARGDGAVVREDDGVCNSGHAHYGSADGRRGRARRSNRHRGRRVERGIGT